ncbi:MAG: DUF1761 domain-containing protein [Proteobacteria bacterium]|nr:DUF1761 domain-containing protein [Pseudomonadota bacterium]
MAFGNIDWIALVAAFVASYAFSAGYYITLAKPWMAAIGKTEAEIKAGASPVAYVVAIVGHVLIAYMLSVLMVTLDAGSVAGGFSIALPMWLAFVVSTMTINHRFQKSSWAHTIIDGGHWLGVFAIQAVVIGLVAG